MSSPELAVRFSRVSRLGLAGDSRLQAARSNLTCQACWKVNSLLAGALQDKTGQLAIRLSRDWISRLGQAARSSREPPLFCIVSNPPYIPNENISGLQAEVGRHEPRLALDGGLNGMDVLLHLCNGAALMLKPAGFLIFEISSTKK
uniref:Uncharacterized protein n=1 Tax=Quercus lobata TaxID=97700 RepID=A0A7N2LL15_QUELO